MRRLPVWMVLAWLAIGVGVCVWAADEDTPSAPAADAPPAADAETGAKPVTPAVNISVPAMERKVSLDFQDASLKDILKLFSQQSGTNFIADQTVRDRKITLYVDNVAVQDVLDQLLRSNNLTAEQPENSNILIIREAAARAVSKTVTRIYHLKYARLSTSVLAKAAASLAGQSSNAASVAETGTSTTSSGASSSGTSSSGGTSLKSTGIDLVVQQFLTPQGKMIADERTNSLIITDMPENFPRLEEMIARLDVKTPQILIEVEMLEVSTTKAKDLGVEWGTGTNTDNTLTTFTPGQATTRFPFGLLSDRVLVPPGGRAAYTLGTLNISQFQAVLKALQSDQETRLLAHPKVLSLDNEEANIQLTANTAIGKNQTTTATGGTGTTTATAERSTTGITLKVTPTINDGGYITMFVEPSLSRPVRSEFFPADFVDPKTRTASTLVRVHDGETIVIGGLVDRTEQTTKRRVPGLANVPLVGAAFRKNDDSFVDTELIVFITPHIVSDNVDSLAKLPLNLPPLAPEQRPPETAGNTEARDATISAALQQLTTAQPAASSH